MSEGDLRTAPRRRRAPNDRWSSPSTDAGGRRCVAHRRQGGGPGAGQHRRAGEPPRRRADHRVLRRHRCRRRRGHPRRRARGVRAGRWRPTGAGRPQLVGGRGHGDVVDGRPVRVGHRHQRLRRVRRRRDGRAGLPATGRSRRPPDRRARPAADRAGVRRGDVRHRPGDRSHRPPGRQRRHRRPGAAGERRGRRLPVRARPVERQGPRLRRQRRPEAAAGRPAAARRAVGQGRRRCTAGRRTSSGRSTPTGSCGCCSRARSPPRSAAFRAARSTAPGPVAETFPYPLTELESDLWVPPLREAVREAVVLAGSATAADVAASEVVVCVDGHVAIDLRLAGEIKPKHDAAPPAQPDSRRPPAARRVAGRDGCGPPCPAWPSTSSIARTPISRPFRR